MAYKKTAGEWIFDTFNVLFLIVMAIAALYPMLYVVFCSISDPVALARSGPVVLYPRGISFQTYQLVLHNQMIAYGYRNTLIIVVLGTAINFFLTALAAYALSRQSLPGKRFLTLGIIFTMQFSGGIIPLYLLVTEVLGLRDTYWAVILPTAINTWYLLIMRTFFASLPVELEESARLDGASDFTILFRIFLPVSKPVVATIVLYYAVGHWNNFFEALIYLRDRTLYPLQLVLREILVQHSVDYMATSVTQDQVQIAEGIKYAVIVVSTVPILCLYPFLQKYFVKGTMIGSIKQ